MTANAGILIVMQCTLIAMGVVAVGVAMLLTLRLGKPSKKIHPVSFQTWQPPPDINEDADAQRNAKPGEQP